MKSFPSLLLAAAGLIAPFPYASSAETAGMVIHVDAAANTPGDGSAIRPFASPSEALKALASRTPEQHDLPATVILHKGTYALAESLVMTGPTGGTKKAPVTWKSAGDGEALLSGGIRIPDSALHPVTDAGTLARLPKDRDASLGLFELHLSDIGMHEFPELESRGICHMYKASWPELFRDGRPLPLSAWPNGDGYAGGFKPTRIISSGTTSEITAGGASATRNDDKGSPMIFSFQNGRTARWKRAIDLNKASVWFGGHWFWDWADDFLPASGIDDRNTITIAKPHHYGMNLRHANLHVYNLVEEMDVAANTRSNPRKSVSLSCLRRIGSDPA